MRIPGVAMAAGLAAGIALPLLPAVGSHSHVQGVSPPKPVVRILPDARLVAGGAGVEIDVSIRCARDVNPYALRAKVQQSLIVRQSRSSEWFDDPVRCRGLNNPQIATVTLGARDVRWLPGKMLASARLYFCRPFDCGSSYDAREVRARGGLGGIP